MHWKCRECKRVVGQVIRVTWQKLREFGSLCADIAIELLYS